MIASKIKNLIKVPEWLLAIVIIFFIVLVLTAAAGYFFERAYREKFYPGLGVAGLDVSGLTKEQALGELNKKIDRFNQNGVIFSYQENKFVLLPLVASMEGDLAYQLITYGADDTAAAALAYGRNGNFFSDLGRKAGLLMRGLDLPILFEINESEVMKILENNFSQFAIPAENARLEYAPRPNPPYYDFTVKPESPGKTLSYGEAIKKLKEQLAFFDDSTVVLASATDNPLIYEKDCLNIEAKAARPIEQAPLSLKAGDRSWTVKREDLAAWLALKLNPSENDPDRVIVSLDEDRVKEYLDEKIGASVNRPPIDAKFEIKDGRVLEFQASADGMELNSALSAAQIENNLLLNSPGDIELTVKELKSAIVMEKINDLGIKKVIGTGGSNFAGSPSNRRHNIRVGADTLNGLLIKPGEEFSLIKALGEIDAAAGYLPELVIKNNRTIPEYGGGLCQIGTTMFRSALGTGLPITMRRNHSYRVSYYEPAGTDATIYNPWPDFKFINDTPNHILIQSRIEGDDIHFDFWGTPDGRIASRTDPVIYNIVRPGPTKIIETTDLKPGEKKCTEKAHNGADAYFDYSVTYSPAHPPAALKGKDDISAENLIIETRFKSHYVPWREVCLVGVAEPAENKTATGTEAVVSDN